ncbi:chromate transporter [Rubellimicrobium arenae]|uniref:chromate transporter n=1 Tax=Rubellimicrobium arenae TaxID=2817372 RepID=UPI001B30F575|nr:chromate transporter [Rubellimicrobium arenae]
MEDDGFWSLSWILVPLSLLSIGGGASIIAGLETEVVRQQGWISSQEFLHMFAVTRAAPGPGTMVATLIEYKLAGWTGAVVATLALFLPSSALFYAVFRTSNRHRGKRWHRVLREGLAPVGTGLMIAGVMAILRLSGGGLLAVGIAGAAAAILYRFPGLSALAIILGGGLATLGLRAWG